MFREATPSGCLSARSASESRRSLSKATLLMVLAAVLIAPYSALAQRGANGRNRRPIICIHDCPDPSETIISESDLKTFDHLIAVQASEEQSGSFNSVVQETDAARAQLQALRETLKGGGGGSSASSGVTTFDQAVEKVRTDTQGFLASFSADQKSGLKDVTDKLTKADTDLERELRTFVEVSKTSKLSDERTANSAANLDRMLTGFQNEQLALASEMSIILPSANQDLTLNLPPVSNAVNVAGQPISVTASGVASRTAVTDGQSLFSLKLVADLSDLQQNITPVLRAELTRTPRCGEHIEIPEATLIPSTPASVVVTHLHYERWICPPGSGSSTELAQGDATMEVRLTASVEQDSNLHLVSEVTRASGDDFLRELLLHGSLGNTLGERIASVVLFALQRGTDLRATLPPSAQDVASIQKAQFQDANVGELKLVLNGQLKLSDDQTKQFANQLKQRLSAQGTSTP
jgi:translation initiation factor 1 (eIF-1/SUI1)